MNEIHEECGVFAVFSPKAYNIASTVYYGLFALQHRGQESCGIVVNREGEFKYYKDSGIVNDVFTPAILEDLGEGSMALGHVRYGTASDRDRTNAQPVVINHINGRMALAQNGSLVNALELRSELELSGSIFHTTGDAELIAYMIKREQLTCDSTEKAIGSVMERIKGAYSFVMMAQDKLVAVRDPNGFRPLCIGTTDDNGFIVASESCALDAVGATFLRDVEPGEIVTIDKDGMHSNREHCMTKEHALCIFEYIYFARPDSVIDGQSVHEARRRAGAFLALEHPVQADVVIGVPDSGLDAALGYSSQSGIPYGIGFVKNKYIGRTFIAPGQKAREDRVRIKLNPISATVSGKRVVLIDDSIVRGTTCARIVRLVREAGATEVHVRISAPSFLYPCYYGTDIDSKENLIAFNHTNEEITKIIGADSLGFLPLADVTKIVGRQEGFCTACFDGKYPTDIPNNTK